MQCPHQNRILARRGSRTVRATPSRAGCVSHVRSPAISSSSSMRSPAMLVCGFPDCPGCPPHSLFLRGPPPIPAPPCFRPPGLSRLAHTSSVTIDMRSPAISSTFLLLASRTVRAGPLSVRSASPCGPPPLPGIFLLLVSRTVRAGHVRGHRCALQCGAQFVGMKYFDDVGIATDKLVLFDNLKEKIRKADEFGLRSLN